VCGLAGFWEGVEGDPLRLEATARAMAGALEHRGPDDGGSWVDGGAGLGLGHRRLSILDLSPDGRQPMVGPDGRFTLAYNGEVYNYLELRSELEAEGVSFRTHTDTEVVLHALACWGVERALERFVGMFAFALWDARERSLVLARDRLGIKPLYYAIQDGVLFFASELKALRQHPRFRAELDRDALTLFFRFSYVPAPHAIYTGARKLLPGTYARFRVPSRFTEHAYWDPRRIARAGLEVRTPRDPREAEERLEDLLDRAVQARRVSDVPLGAFLSGGVDSSLVVALLQELSDRPAETFTIGFDEEGYDEAPHARAIARHLGTRHHELVVTSDEARAVIPELPESWDEPFADSSQIPTLIVSRFARTRVTVCLSGDGGDELFGGYPRYFLSNRLDRTLRRFPGFLRRGAAAGLRGLPNGLWEGLARRSATLRRKGLQPGWAAYRVNRLADVLALGGRRSVYRSMVSHWKEPERLVLGGTEPCTVHEEADLLPGGTDYERMMLADTLTYLPDDILCKVDRASMATGLEARVPLLDHRVLELAWSLPLEQRMGPEPGKSLLRRVLAKRVPRELFERPKMGFGVPIAAWLRGPLRAWGEELCDARRLASEGVLDPVAVREAWDAHQAERASLGYYLWDVLAFQAWHERWMGADAPRPPGALPRGLEVRAGGTASSAPEAP